MKTALTWTVLILALSLVRLPAEEARPLTLKDARAIALKRHPQISEAELLALAARQVVTEVRSAYYPSVMLNATSVGSPDNQTRLAASDGFSNSRILDRNAEGVLINQLITDFGRTAHLSKSSQYHFQAQGQGTEATRQQVLVAVDSAYLGALRAQAVLNVANQTLATRQLVLDQVSVLASNGIKSELDAVFARVDREQARLLVAKGQTDVQAALALLARVLGDSRQPVFQLAQEPLVTNAPPGAEDLVQTALTQRPDLAQLRLEQNSASQFALAQKALRNPTLNAFGAGGVVPVHDPIIQDDRYATAGVDLSIPLFTGGLFRAKQREAQFQAQAAAEKIRDAEEEVIRQVRVASLNVQFAFEQIGLTEQLLASASEAFQLAQANYKVGRSSIVELSQSQLNLTSAEIAETSAKFDYQIQRSLLSYEIGAQQ